MPAHSTRCSRERRKPLQPNVSTPHACLFVDMHAHRRGRPIRSALVSLPVLAFARSKLLNRRRVCSARDAVPDSQLREKVWAMGKPVHCIATKTPSPHSRNLRICALMHRQNISQTTTVAVLPQSAVREIEMNRLPDSVPFLSPCPSPKLQTLPSPYKHIAPLLTV